MMQLAGVFAENLIEILIGLVVMFNVGAYSYLWRRIERRREKDLDLESKIGQNSETVNVILHRIFGIDEDPTDKGYIMESKNRFDEVSEKLDRIGEKQNEACRSRERMEKDIQSIMEVLEREENININPSDFNE